MLRIIETFSNLPEQIEVDPDAYFQPGQIGSLRIKKGKSVIGVCDGLNPFGIIDDVRTNVFRGIPRPYTQVHIVPVSPHRDFDELKLEWVLTQDKKVDLNHTNIIKESFKSSILGCLNPINGVFTLPKGTILNYCLVPSVNGYPVNDAVRFSCEYAYNVSAIYYSGNDGYNGKSVSNDGYGKIEDSTLGSNRVTLWTKNMIVETDMFDTSQTYSKYCPLYVQNGLLTTKRNDIQCKCVGMVLSPPDVNNSMLRYLWDLNGKVESHFKPG